LAALLSVSLGFNMPVVAQNQQSTVPDAPTPQAGPPLLGTSGPITPGEGSGEVPAQGSSSSAPTSATPDEPPAPPIQPPAPAAQSPVGQDADQGPAPEGGNIAHFVVNVNFVEVPVTVKDTKLKLVSGLTWRDFKVYENGAIQHLAFFSVDSQPLSVAFVIDQSLTSNIMDKVNDSLAAIQGALTPYDEAAVFTYGNGPKEWTGFTGAQGNRLPAVLALAKATGTDPMVPDNSGPFAGCNIRENGNCVDPNLQPGRSAGNDTFITIPREIHTLNDAILAAAKELSTRPKERRRLIYVISDGKEYGSKATQKEVTRFLQTNNIEVWATQVGDSAIKGTGFLDRIHIPLMMRDDVLPKYTAVTGGQFDSEFRPKGIEESFGHISVELRSQYIVGYYTHESPYNESYRSTAVTVMRPDLTIICKEGYYPSAADNTRARPAPAQQAAPAAPAPQ
jgi:VWFA-related protein